MRPVSILLATLGLALLMTTPSRAIDPRRPESTQSSSTEQTASSHRSESPAVRGHTGVSPGTWMIASTDSSAYFADPSQVTVVSPGIRRMWVTMVYRQPQNGVKYAIVFQEFACATNESRDLSGAFYDLHGQVVDRVTPSDLSPAIPQSAGAGVVRHACAGSSTWGNSELGSISLPVGATPVTYVDNVVFAGAPANDELFGTWGANGDCANSLVLNADGSFALPTLKRNGSWQLRANSIHMVYLGGGQDDGQINWVDHNNLRLTTPSNSVLSFRRC
jgi:hypothetical protein